MSKIKMSIAKFITAILIINSMFSGVYANIFANTKIGAKEATNLNFDWQRTLNLTDNLATINRTNGSEEVFLTWEFEKDSQGAQVGNGTYELTYNIDDDKQVKFEIKKSNDVATVKYYIKKPSTTGTDYSNTITKDDGYVVYKTDRGSYIEPTKDTYPPIAENFEIVYAANNGKAKNVEFKITKGNGFSFKYKNNTVKFKWNLDGKFYFSTSGVKQGNIYDFNLSLNKGTGATKTDSNIKVFTGLNTSTLKVTPKANDGKGTVDQTARPISEYPGEKAQIEVEFDMPKEWDTTTNKYIVKKTNAEKTEVVFNLNHSDDSKKIQIIIDDIYKDISNNTSTETTLKADVATSSQAKVTAKRDAKNEKVTMVIDSLEPGMIYTPVTISVSRPTVPHFLTVPLDIEIGKFYTYPKFSIVSLGTSEFYIRIEPFKDYDGYYTIKVGDTSNTISKWSVYEDKNKGKEGILIPVNLNAINRQTKYFQVDFSLTPPEDTNVSNAKIFKSQILKYTPHESDIILGTPDNLEILDSEVIFNPITQKNEMFTELKWDMSYNNILKALVANNKGKPVTINYTFSKGNTPEDTDVKEFLSLNLTVSNKGDQIDIQISEKDSDNYLISSEIIETDTIIANQSVKIISPKVKIKMEVSPKEKPTTVFVYPSVNFISVKGEYTINDQEIVTSSSIPVNISIDQVSRVVIQQPQEIKAENVGTNSFDVIFRTMAWKQKNDILYPYKTKILDRIGLGLKDDSVKYEFYITQERELINSLIDEKIEKDKIKEHAYTGNMDSFNFSEIKIDEKTAREHLREKNVVKIKDVLQNGTQSINQKMKFLGLDTNQVYYVVVKAFVTPYQDDIKKEEYTRDSKYSTIVSLTTLIDKNEPAEGEKDPIAVENFNSENVTLNSVNLVWDKVYETNPNSNLEYQFIRVKGSQLSDKFLNSKISYKDFWSSISSEEKFGFKTSQANILAYNQVDSRFTEVSSNQLEYVTSTPAKGNILDKTLNANQIYFYYIRTVRIADGKEVAYSVWKPLSVTTKSIESPKNLKIELSEIKNKKTEVAISFDAPKMEIEDLKTNYNIYYSLKKDTGNWGLEESISPSSATFAKNSDGTIKVTYVIKGLTHGSLYSIRVRLYSKPLKVYSNYSNEVTHRTDVDPNQDAIDQGTDEWVQNYETLLDQIKKQDYWYLTNNLATTSVLYRPGYIENTLNATNSSVVDLVTGLNGTKKEYYIPASEIIKIFDSNKSIRIKFKETEIIFSAKSINPNLNDAILNIKQTINTGTSRDYFVKITTIFNEGKFNIEGASNLSPSIDISLQAIGTSSLISSWDSEMLKFLDTTFEKEFKDNLNKYIRELITSGTKDTEIYTLINKKLDSFKESFGEKVKLKINNITKRTYTSEKLNANLIIAQQISPEISSQAYVLEGYAWRSATTSTYGSKKAIYTTKLGAYIFAGKKIFITGIGNIQNGALITQMITKYSLDDYLGKSGNIDLNAKMQRNNAIGIVARISGASKTEDPVSYFKSKGVILSTRGLDSNISNQESIFLIMKAYEHRTNTKIDTIKITNYNLTAGISGLNSNYKKAVQTAFQTGIYTNSNMDANGTITVREFLQTLANLITKVGL